jgi:hypothetical protein
VQQKIAPTTPFFKIFFPLLQVAALQWIHHLFLHRTDQMQEYVDPLTPVLLKTLSGMEEIYEKIRENSLFKSDIFGEYQT